MRTGLTGAAAVGRLIASLTFLSVLALAGCKVVEVTKPIKEGQPVRIDPCSVVTKADAEKILGAPALPKELQRFAGEDAALECTYRKADGPDYGDLVSLTISPQTRANLLVFYPGEPVAIGKEGRLASGANDIQVNVLNKNGVQYELQAAVAGKDLIALQESVKALAPKIDERIGKAIGKTFKPPAMTTSADVDPSALLPGPEIEPLVGPAGEDGWVEGTSMFRFESFGGRWGGSRSCRLYTAPGPDERDELSNSVLLKLAKPQVSIEQIRALQGEAETVPRLGAHAYWVSQELSVPSDNPVRHDKSWLVVLTKGGRLFEVEVDLHLPGTHGEEHFPEDQHKKVSIDLAKKVLAKLP